MPHFERGDELLQDNAPPHVSSATKQWLSDHDVPLIPFPARSPDLNPMENVWALLVRDVYRGDRRYYSMNELKYAILASWSGVTQDALNGLARSMSDGLFHCIAAKGGSTKY